MIDCLLQIKFLYNYLKSLEPGLFKFFCHPGILQLSSPSSYLGFMLEHGYDHQRNKEEDQWRDTHERDPFAPKHPAHRAFQPFSDQVHAWHHD